MRNFFYWAVPWLACTFVSCKVVNGIPVIGIDGKGKPSQVLIPEKDYSKRLVAVTSTVQQSGLKVLNQREVRPGLSLRTVSVGVGLNAQIGIGPFQIGAIPRSRLIFSNSKEPTLP